MWTKLDITEEWENGSTEQLALQLLPFTEWRSDGLSAETQQYGGGPKLYWGHRYAIAS